MGNRSKNRKQFILSVICIMILILFSVGLVYAFFNYTKQGSRNNVINTSKLSFSFEDSEFIWLENAYPMTARQALTLELNGSSDLLEVDGGIAQFKVIGGNNSVTINYYISLLKEDVSNSAVSKNNIYSFSAVNKIGQLPDGAVSINLQSSTTDIFETVGLVDDPSKLLNPNNSFSPAVNESYINTQSGVSIDKLPQGTGTNEKIIGNGTISGNSGTRYFELRMWINDTVMVNDELRTACLSSTSSGDITTNGRGYCNPSTSGLPSGIKYVYSTGEFSKLYYSNRIKIETTDVVGGIVDSVPSITKTLLAANTPVEDNTVDFNYTAGVAHLMKMKSTENDAYPIYYYRGNVTNNHVLFGGYCWRIVRTTETGGTKLVYDGTPSNGTCPDSRTDSYIDTDVFYAWNQSPAYLGYKTGSVRQVYSTKQGSSLNSVVYGKNIQYQNGMYILTDTVKYSTYASGYSESNGIKYHHYSCLDSSTTCSTVAYIYLTDSSTIYYFNLTNGKTHLDLLNEMLSDNDGTSNSNAYNILTNWYSNHLLSYASQLEDTVFCNDRSVYSYGGWNIDSPNNQQLIFSSPGRLSYNLFNSPSLVCQNHGDRYTVNSSNGNGQLEYPIGLLTAEEYVLAGAKSGYSNVNTDFYLYNGNNQFSMTPNLFSIGSVIYQLKSNGSLYGLDVNDYPVVLRPAVSLSKDTRFTSAGNGTSTNPYIVDN